MRLGVVSVALISLAACQGTSPTAERRDEHADSRGGAREEQAPPAPPQAASTATSAPDRVAVAGAPTQQRAEQRADSDAGDFLQRLVVQQQERRAACRHFIATAERQMGELQYTEARKSLQRALTADPDNQNAQRLFDSVGFLLGDRASEIREITRELQNQARVSETQAISDMHLLFEDGVKLLEAGEASAAGKVFERLLARIHYHESSSSKPLVFRKKVEALRQQAQQQEDAQSRD